MHTINSLTMSSAMRCVWLVLAIAGAAQSSSPHEASDFDVLIFTQQWPVSTCMEWKSGHPKHKCSLPTTASWTIHGVWPTKLGTIGPAFCNRNASFDPTQLEPLKPQLDQFWTKIETGQALWKHEWLKHGTCASVLSPLDSEPKYFGQGLQWLQNFTMTDVLARAGIMPDGRPSLEEIHDAVVRILKRRPYIHCWHHPTIREPFLSEIRICFDKNLQLANCDGIKMEAEDLDKTDEMNSNCPTSGLLYYPSVMFALTDDRRILEASDMQQPPVQPAQPEFSWLSFYKILNLIKMVTL